MKTKQTVAILGASGEMGSGIALSLAESGYRLLLCSGDVTKLSPLVAQIQQASAAAEVEAIGCSHNACWEADIILPAIPYRAQAEVAAKIREVANQKIVISISNPLNDAFDALLTGPESSAAEELQALLPNSKVVKAFNTVFAADFAAPLIAGQQVDAFIAGNEPAALETVSELVRATGLNPVIAGDLSVSRTLEGMALLLIQLAQRHNYTQHAGWKVLHD